MSGKPAISIIISATKDRRFLSTLIRSILTQKFNDLEVILFDTRVTGSPKKRNYFRHSTRIASVHIRKLTTNSCSFNYGLSIAKGKYICFMDARSIMLRNRLKILHDYMESHRKVGCTGSTVEYVDEHGALMHTNRQTIKLVRASLLVGSTVLLSSLIFRTSSLKTARLRFNANLKYAFEYDFVVRAFNALHVQMIHTTILRHVADQRINHYRDLKKREKEINLIRIQTLKTVINLAKQSELDLHLKLMCNEYLPDDELQSAISWLNLLLRQNETRKQYDSRSLYQVLETVIVKSVRTNNLGGWSIEKKMLLFIKSVLRQGKTILEFGSGIGTDALLKYYKVISIENNKSFAFKRNERHLCLYSPLENDWYDRVKVRQALLKNPDMLLVDGPPGTLRQGILSNIDLFSHLTVPVIFDDIDRILDQQVMLEFCRKLGYTYRVFTGDQKQFAFCEKQLSCN